MALLPIDRRLSRRMYQNDSQIRRASVSVAANIAEGHSRDTPDVRSVPPHFARLAEAEHTWSSSEQIGLAPSDELQHSSLLQMRLAILTQLISLLQAGSEHQVNLMLANVFLSLFAIRYSLRRATHCQTEHAQNRASPVPPELRPDESAAHGVLRLVLKLDREDRRAHRSAHRAAGRAPRS